MLYPMRILGKNKAIKTTRLKTFDNARSSSSLQAS